MSDGTRFEFDLFVRSPAEDVSDSRRFAVPSAPVHLVVDGAGNSLLSSEPPPRGREIGVVEPLETARGPRLLVLVSAPRDAGRALRVNDQPMPRVACLRDGDVLMASGGRLFRVALFRRPSIGPARAALAGKECPVCRTALSEDTRVFRCPCGAAIHLEDAAARAAGEALECARLGAECPTCGREIVLEAGFASDPES